eukprot:3940563-Rhodomonas_salina.1
MVLRCCYAMCGTELAYGATLLLRDVWYWASVWCYAAATRCAVLSWRMLHQEQTERAEQWGSSLEALRMFLRLHSEWWDAMSGTELAYGGMRGVGAIARVGHDTKLRRLLQVSSSAMSGTDMPYRAISLRVVLSYRITTRYAI